MEWKVIAFKCRRQHTFKKRQTSREREREREKVASVNSEWNSESISQLPSTCKKQLAKPKPKARAMATSIKLSQFPHFEDNIAPKIVVVCFSVEAFYIISISTEFFHLFPSSSLPLSFHRDADSKFANFPIISIQSNETNTLRESEMVRYMYDLPSQSALNEFWLPKLTQYFYSSWQSSKPNSSLNQSNKQTNRQNERRQTQHSHISLNTFAHKFN